MLEHADLTGALIGAAIDVHKALGPGFLEKVYERAFEIELKVRGIPFENQRKVPVLYRGLEVARHELDFFVADEVVVELKAIKTIEDVHFAVVRSYLRAMGKRHGLILNFAKTKLEAKRVHGTDWPPAEAAEMSAS